jgi:hypothetical protein
MVSSKRHRNSRKTKSKNRTSKHIRRRRSKSRLYPNRRMFPTCLRQFTKKYTERPSPPYSANYCCNKKKVGNDGNMWKSTPNVHGVCTWKKM